MTAAYRVLRDHGVSGLSLRRIAEQVGVSEPAVHKRVGSKQALLVELQRWATEQTRALLVCLDEPAPVDGLRRLVRTFARQVSSPAELAHLLSFSAQCLADRSLRAHAQERQILLTDSIAAALRRARYGRPDALARAVVALLDGVPVGWATRADGSLERMLLESLDLLLQRNKEAAWMR